MAKRAIRMKRTWENLLIGSSLGAGVALIASGHRKLGWAIASIAPGTVATLHPRATWRTLKAVPAAVGISAKAVAVSSAAGGKAMWKTSETIGRTLGMAARILSKVA